MMIFEIKLGPWYIQLWKNWAWLNDDGIWYPIERHLGFITLVRGE